MLYLRAELLNKSKDRDGKPSTKADSNKPADVSGGRGEQRGGAYVARVQVGYEKDGSPKYRYFKSNEDYETYLKGKGRSPEAKKLEHKVKQEHAESTDKHTGAVIHQPASKQSGLLSTTKKSLALYVRNA
jgi:hypothetical protein